ncbi:hypothetical protein SBBP2_70058 [Burkholderiales bacterium]|nr:hypothetical protein SBBP2_70058 [Burkholderiales bacterium]
MEESVSVIYVTQALFCAKCGPRAANPSKPVLKEQCFAGFYLDLYRIHGEIAIAQFDRVRSRGEADAAKGRGNPDAGSV